MYFTPRPFVTIYTPIMPSLSLPQIMTTALKKSLQQYSSMFMAQIKQAEDQEEKLSESGQTKTSKLNEAGLTKCNRVKRQNFVETDLKKQSELPKAQNKGYKASQKVKRQSFLRAKTHIVEVLQALSQEQLESNNEENQELINYKNKSESTIQNLKTTTKRQKKIHKQKFNKNQLSAKRSTYLVVVPSVSLLETIELPKFLMDIEQITRRKHSLLERIVCQENSTQKVKTFVSRQRRQMMKLF